MSLQLQTIWVDLASAYSDDRELIDRLWLELHTAYTGKKRHYHNFDHIALMIGLAQAHRSDLEDFETVMFSIFYHDIVYNATRKDNEWKSAERASERLRELDFPAPRIARCHAQVLATKDHELSDDPDTNYLLDFDLAILAEPEEIYMDYCRRIRKEYAIYPDLMYNPARKKALRHILDMEHIFKTETFRAELESKARENIRAELSRL